MDTTPRTRRTSLAWLSGLLIGLGVLGFVPGITNDYYLFNLFEMSPWLNAIYIFLGLAGLAALATRITARAYAKLLTVVFALWAVIGLVVGDYGQVLGFINNNYWTVALNAVLALAAASIGWAGVNVRQDQRSVAFGEYHAERRDRRR